ncbi:MAG: hypothetical protein K2W96_14540 [Gemmataceae bacterium]|nr:hypothetical protein [Gemmataceae bacterium]
MARRILALAFGGGIHADTKKPESKKPEAKKAATHPGLEQLKKLAGTWVEIGKDGKPTDKVVSVVKVISAGSVVHETLFPGSPMEMIRSTASTRATRSWSTTAPWATSRA